MIINAEIAKHVSKEVLQVTNHLPDGFISNSFIRPKKDGAFRMILNLKPLNKFVDYHYFKMDTFPQAYPSWMLYGICRFQGCLLFHSHSRGRQKALHVSKERETLSVYMLT